MYTRKKIILSFAGKNDGSTFAVCHICQSKNKKCRKESSGKSKNGIMGCTAMEEGKSNHNGKSGSGIDTNGIRAGKGIIHNSL